MLTLELVPDPAAPDRGEPSAFERQMANRFKIADRGRPGDGWLIDTVRLAWRKKQDADSLDGDPDPVPYVHALLQRA